MKRVASTHDLNAILFRKKFHYYWTALFMRDEKPVSFEWNEFERHIVSQISDPRYIANIFIKELYLVWLMEARQQSNYSYIRQLTFQCCVENTSIISDFVLPLVGNILIPALRALTNTYCVKWFSSAKIINNE